MQPLSILNQERRTAYAFWKLKMRSSSHTCISDQPDACVKAQSSPTHIAEISVQHLDVAMDDLERHQLVVSWRNAANEEQRRVAAVDDLRVCEVSKQPMCRGR